MHVEPHTGVFCCRHVLKEGAPAQQVIAEHDGDFQIVCWNGDHSSAEQCAWVHLHHLTDRDPSIGDALETLNPGQRGYRLGVDQPWVFEALPSWDLLDVVEHSRQHPATFHIPPDFVREGLRVGDFAKLVFESPAGGERMWVRVDEVRDGGYIGTLDNEPVVITDLVIGDVVAFGPYNVCDAQAPEQEVADASTESAPAQAPPP